MKRGYEASFTWIFVLLVGASIIVTAVYVSMQFLDTSRTEYNTKVAAELGTILSPIETGIESGKYYQIRFSDTTRLVNTCDEEGTYGMQHLSAQVRSGLGKEWQSEGEAYSVPHKYVFSTSRIEGNEFEVVSMPFNFPYKIADLIIMYDTKYCFVSPPEAVEDELLLLGMPFINITANRGACSEGSVSVCFSGSGCSIMVNRMNDHQGTVRKSGVSLDYYDSLMYAAIFSDPSIYQCQVKRLLKRGALLAELYSKKSAIIRAQGCTSSLEDETTAFGTQLSQGDMRSLTVLSTLALDLEVKNDRLACPLF